MHSDESKAKLSQSNRKAVQATKRVYKFGPEFREKCRQNNTGKILSEQTRTKLRNAQLGRIPGNAVKIWVEGILYDSLRAAAAKTGLPMSTLRNRISSLNPVFSSYYRDEKI